MQPYPINQFHVESDLNLRCDPRLQAATGSKTICLPVAHAPGTLSEFAQVHWLGRRFGTPLRSYDVGDGVLACVADCLRIHIDRAGSRVTLDFDDRDAWARGYASACTVNLALSLCTLLQGDLPLHGAAAELDGLRFALMAPSGTGKSTLLWALLDQGALFANDDVTPLRVREGPLVAAPSGSLHAKLSRTALEERDLDPARYEPMLPDAREFWVPIEPERRAHEEKPLTALFVLQPGLPVVGAKPVVVRRAMAGAAVALLMQHTQGLWAVAGVLDGRRILSRYAAVLQSSPIFTLEYPRRVEILPELVKTIRQVLDAVTGSAAPAAQPRRRPAGRFPHAALARWWAPLLRGERIGPRERRSTLAERAP